MSLISLKKGMKFKGDLYLFNNKYDYELNIVEIIPDDNEFLFEHIIAHSGMTIDKKTGRGKYENKDVNIAIVKYKDIETEFEGDLNLNIFEIMGNARQIMGKFKNDEGNFNVNLISLD